jgi:tripartite-type tricarboxylate transporter receptor subunit TctC
MKKILLILVMTWCSVAQPTEVIRIQTPYTASHSGTPAMLRIIETANRIQKDFTFVLDFRPGGNQTIAVKQMDLDPQRNLAIIAASFVENTEQKTLVGANYVPIWSLGDACWVVMSTTSANSTILGLQQTKELIVGTVGFGNATHLTALQIGQKYNLTVRLVPFKSNYDAVINMTGNNGVTFGIDTPASFESLKSKNTQMQMLAVSCPKRLPDYASIKTLHEQGIVAPSVINIVVANVAMSADRQQQLSRILELATEKIGETEIRKLSGFAPPQFDQITAQEHFTKSISLIRELRARYEKEIKQAQ